MREQKINHQATNRTMKALLILPKIGQKVPQRSFTVKAHQPELLKRKYQSIKIHRRKHLDLLRHKVMLHLLRNPELPIQGERLHHPVRKMVRKI